MAGRANGRSDLPAVRSETGFAPSGFFALRTPLLPRDELTAWSEGLEAEAALDDPTRLEDALAEDRVRLRGRLRALVSRPTIRDALFVASPDLDESLDVWIRDPDSERGRRIERALVRYFSRMSGRPTPFGLLAGTSVGTIGDRTQLVVEGRETYRRRSRLDMDYLSALADAIARDPALRKSFLVRPNSSLYRAAGRFHYVEARLDGKDRTHHLVAVEDSGELQGTLERAREGADAAALAAALVDDDVSATEADEYVSELIDSQILRPELDPFVTGSDSSEALATQLSEHPETSAIGDRLAKARADLAALDETGPGADPSRYREIARQLEDLPAPVELSRLFQVDLIKPAPAARLGGAVLDEIVRGVGILHRLVPPRNVDDLSRFREAFLDRFGEREVPLAVALDDEAGIGFPPSNGVDTEGGPLLKGLVFPSAPEETVRWGAREKLLLGKLAEATATGAREIALEPDDLDELSRKDVPALPDAFDVTATLAAASPEALSRGDFRLLWMGGEGPSGARLLGRFCDADANLRRCVERHLRAEEALDPDAVFAEVVHLPEGRLGNVLCRPLLRDYEIPYLGRSGASADRQIPINDLLVSVSGGRIVLRSAVLDRRVVPRLTSAHNFRWRSIGGLYRFLCELQGQNSAAALGWDWGPLGSAPFLPRVVSGRLVLAPAQWLVGKEELERLGGSRGSDQFRVIHSWRAERSLPRVIVLADGDNRLPIDLANILSVETFVHLIKDRDEAKLTEMFPGTDDLCASGPEGRFLHELVVPFVRNRATAEGATRLEVPKEITSRRAAPALRSFPPGSEWIYAKLYAGPSTADRVLREIVGPLVREMVDSGVADRWFFIRYGDPDWHLRLRFHGARKRLGEALSALNDALGPLLADGRVWKVQLDTYEREVERYGGPEGIALAERIFQVDSEAVLEILEILETGDEGEDERWRMALFGIDRLIQDFGFDRETKGELMDRLRRDPAGEHDADDGFKRGLGDRFRKESRSLEALLDPTRRDESPLAPGIVVLRRRSDRLIPRMGELRSLEAAGRLSQPLAAIAPSFVHMHANRLLRSAHRNQEIVLYDFLARIYESRTARERSGRPRVSPTER